ncbi:MAG: hypothetical protein KH026_08625 [Clostridium sp.]|nr:hypothetical protein [Clostridium sp.]
MIIIEETEEDKNRAALLDEDSFEDEELTTEEAKYRSAKDLRDSLECVERYEQGVRTLLDAAALFDEIDDYEDSARLAEKCRKKAKDYEKKGMEKAYQQAVKLCGEAVTKMDYRTAITELERFPQYKDSRQRIEACKKEIVRLETKAAWKNRIIALVVIAVMALCIWGVFSLLL